jgi:HEAT repeat protein
MFWWTLIQLKSSKPEVRAKAAHDLGAAKQRKAVPSLIKSLDDDSVHVRIAVIEALGTIGHPASAEPLATALANLPKTAKSRSGHPDRRDEMAEYGSLAKALGALGPPAVRPLLQLLGSEDKEPRRWAACALGAIKDPQATDRLIETLEDNRSEVRKAAALALGEIGDSRALQSLIKAIANRDLETRRAAAEALGSIGSESAADALEKALADQSEAVQLSAIHSLAKIGGLRPASCLRSATTGPRKTVCEAAASALKTMKFSPANAEECAEMAVILGDFVAALKEGPAAIPALIKTLRFKDPRMRAKAAEALGSLRSREAVPSLLEALRDHNPEVQEAAAQALANAGIPALEGLESSLTFYDSSVARLAACAVGRIGDARSVPALVKMVAGNRSISHEYPEMLDAVKAAVEALGGILASLGEKISQRDLESIAELPEEICLLGSQPSRTVDCTHLRDQARQELLKRS